MLQILIDPSMLSAKPNNSDCELTINIAGCAWPADTSIKIPDFPNREAMMEFFYPWYWRRPKYLNIFWLRWDKERKLYFLADDRPSQLEMIYNAYPEFEVDSHPIGQHYQDILNIKLIKNEPVGQNIELNENEIRYDLLGKVSSPIVIDDNHADPGRLETGLLTMSLANFAQKLSPNNLELQLAFFAKGNAVTAPADATHFVAYPLGEDQNDRWSSKIRYRLNHDDGSLDVTYINGAEQMKLHCPSTPIPQKSQAHTPIQLRDDDGNFLGHTDLEVYDFEDQMAELSNKLSPLFDLPKILCEFIAEKEAAFVKKDTTTDKDYCDWIKLINVYFLSSINDSIANQTILMEILEDRNRLDRAEDIRTIIDVIGAKWSHKIAYDEWKKILSGEENLKPLVENLDLQIIEFKQEKAEEFVKEWIQNLKGILKLIDILEVQKNIILLRSSAFSEDEVKKLSTAIDNFGDVRNVLFNGIFTYAKKFLFRKKLNLNNDAAKLEFSDRFKIALFAYMKKRVFPSTTIDLYPEIITDPFLKVPVDYPAINWASVHDFINRNYTDDINDRIKQLIEKPTDIPPPVMIKVDTLDIISSNVDKTDDLSDEIAGHLILMQRGQMQNEPADLDNVDWKALNWSRINLNNVVDKTATPLENDYLIPAFLPEINENKNIHLSLSNERLSLIAGHETFKDNDKYGNDEISIFTFSYLFQNIINEGGEDVEHNIPAAYALWYGYHYNFAGFVALNSGVLPKAIRKDPDNWSIPSIGQNQIDHSISYEHYRRVPIANPFTKMLREDGKELLALPPGLLPLACELPEWHSRNSIQGNKHKEENLPVYLLYDNGDKNKQQQDKIKLDIGKPLTSFWNWYAWKGNNLSTSDLGKVLEQELLVRGNKIAQNSYLHDPALSNTIVIVVEQIFPIKEKGEPEILELELAVESDAVEPILNKALNIEKVLAPASSGKFIINGKIEIPDGYVVKISIHCQTKKEYYKKDTNKFHSWMANVVDSKSRVSSKFANHYLTHPVEIIVEAAMKPSIGQRPLILPDLLWQQLKPTKTQDNQVILDLEKNDLKYAYYSRTKVNHQVWHWNGRLVSDLLNKEYISEADAVKFSDNINPAHNGNTNFAMKWEAWEFSDRPDFSSLQNTINLKATRIDGELETEKQTLFTDNRPADDRALYYRFSAELFGRYELLGGVYKGSVKSIIVVDGIPNLWKRFVKKSEKPAGSKLPKPVIRFAIPLTASIDECAKPDEINSAAVMIVLNDRWFAELGLAEKLEVGIELLKHQAPKEEDKYYLNAGPDPILSGKNLDPIDLSRKDIIIEQPDNDLNDDKKENPIMVFTPEGPAGLTFDFATATPKLIGSTFILKVKDVNKLMGPWSMVQIAARRTINKHFWNGAEKETLKSEWTAKQWVQFLPDTNSMIPFKWKKSNANYGFVAFEIIDGNLKAMEDFVMPVLTTDSSEDSDVETKTEKYLILSERIQNAGGQPTEAYSATLHYTQEKTFVLNDADPGFDLKNIKEGFARIIVVRVTNHIVNKNMNLWNMLFGENINRSIPFDEVQKDPMAALPLISKRFSIKIKQ
jgi:hypothetical protein